MKRRDMAMKTKTANKGFTLIELLVVISIIALLLSILMPALSKVKAKAQSVVCRSNVKQMHLGWFMYAGDNDNKGFDYSAAWGLWLHRLTNYCGELEQIRYCPSTKVGLTEEGAYYAPSITAFGTARMTWYEDWIPNPNEGGARTPEYGSYAYNGWMYTTMPSNAGGTSTVDKMFGKMDASQGNRIPLIMDSAWLDLWPLDTDVPSSDLDLFIGEWPPSMGMLWINRHDMRCNTVFVDGHAEGVKLEDLWKLKWHLQFKYRSDIQF